MKSALLAAFDLNLAEGLEQGGAVAVWQDGQEVCCLCGGEAKKGEPWADSTLVPIFSATKPAAAACVLQALYDCCQSPELAVGDVWENFPNPRLTVGELLSHQGGLAALSAPAPLGDLEACRRSIEQTRPLWAPPQHGYHPQTFGPLVDILLRELSGMRVSEFWEKRVRLPLGLDFYIGHLPQEKYADVAELRTARMLAKMPSTPFYRAYFDAENAVHRAFHSIDGFNTAREMNCPAAWQCGSPAKGGVASARGLALFYQALLGKLPNGPFAPEVAEWLATPQCSGLDLTLLQHTAFTCGAMCEPAEYFPRGGFGHAGAGGSHAFCVSAEGLSFAYVMRGMELGNLPGLRVQRLLAALA